MSQLERLPFPLLEWFGENARRLPWRDDPVPYHVWLSEIMLQQTRVAAVLDYYCRFLERVPTIKDLAELDPEQLMKLWQGLGYYSRARNLQKAARQIMENFDGEFPREYQQIRSLAGVGEYTAGAIASIAFGQHVSAVDGNVLRVISRITGDDSDITLISTKRRVARDLEQIIPLGQAGRFNQALMELGATVCIPNGAPMCDRCPAKEFCRARLEGRTEQLPVKAPKKARRVEKRIVFLIFHEGQVALRRRPEKGLLAGLWEYPTEPVPAKDALERWCIQGRRTDGGTGRHIFTHVEWHMKALCVEAVTPDLPKGWVWADRAELAYSYAVPNAFRAFEPMVRERLGYFG